MYKSRQILVLMILPLMVSACSIRSYIKDANYNELFSLHGDAHFKEDTNPLSKQKLQELSVSLRKNGASCGQNNKTIDSNIVCYSLYGTNGSTKMNIWDLNLKKQTVRRYGRELNEWWNSDELLKAQKSFATADGRTLL